MKKLIVTALGLLIAIVASAQVKQYEYEVAEFDAISVSNEFDVSVIAGEKYGLSLTVDEPLKEYVNFNVKNGLLSISLDEKSIPSDIKKMYKGKNTPDPTYRVMVITPGQIGNVALKDKAIISEVLNVPAKENVSITVSDNAQIRTFGMDAKEVKLSVDKKASAVFSVTAAKLEANFAGNSNVDLTCDVKSAALNVSGACKFVLHGGIENMDFTTKGTAVSILNGDCGNALYSTSGTVEVNALNLTTLNANVCMNGLGTLTQSASEKLKVELTGGATLVFNNNPEIDVVGIKSSTFVRYGSNTKSK